MKEKLSWEAPLLTEEILANTNSGVSNSTTEGMSAMYVPYS
jgi:hypothetical protein